MFIYTYLKEYFYFVYCFRVTPGISTLTTLACFVILLLGDRNIGECQEVTFHQRYFKCRWPITELMWHLTASLNLMSESEQEGVMRCNGDPEPLLGSSTCADPEWISGPFSVDFNPILFKCSFKLT